MHSVRQQHHVRIAGGIDPQTGPRKSCVSKAADGEARAAWARERGVDVPAKPALGDARGWSAILLEDGGPALGCLGLLRDRHRLQRRLRQREGPRVAQQLVQQRLRKQADVLRIGEDACVARHAAHPPRCRVMHHSLQQPVEVRVRLLCSLVVVGGRRNVVYPVVPVGKAPVAEAVALGNVHCVLVPAVIQRQVERRLHAERIEDMLLGIRVQGLAAQLLHQRAQRNVVHVGVDKLRSRQAVQLGLHCAPDALRLVRRGQSPRIFQVNIRRQAGVVGQQLAHRHALLAVRRKLRQILHHRRVHVDLALLHQLHDCRRCHQALGQRGHIEDRIRGHGPRGCGPAVRIWLTGKLADPIRVLKDDLVVVADKQDRPGELLLRNRRLDRR